MLENQSRNLRRCQQEIEQIQADADKTPMRAWLVTLGMEDWEAEKRLIEQEKSGCKKDAYEHQPTW